ncbi:MAG: glycosyltransferase [Chitinophagaceae bacterium]|nr:glycosyltransferase [Chitinophagaceae bacterium]
MTPKTVMFLPDVIGGVNSVISNVVSFNAELPPFKVVAYSNTTDKREQISNSPFAKNITRISINPRNNLYFTLRKLNKAVTEPTDCIVATDSLELSMVDVLRLPNKLVFMVLGDFQHYYTNAVNYDGIIDKYIAISKEIFEKLVQLLPHRKRDITLAYFPTPPVSQKKYERRTDALHVIYAARLDEQKNVLLLPQIDEELKNRGINVEWTIVGDGPLRSDLEAVVKSKTNFALTGFLGNKSLHEAYLHHDIFITTSLAEGLPVSVVEAMKTGLVPVVSDISGGLRELINNQQNGFLCQSNNEIAFADALEKLYHNREMKKTMSVNAREFANATFDPIINSNKYWQLFAEAAKSEKVKIYNNSKLLLFDKSWLPNSFVRNYRDLKGNLRFLLFKRTA